VAQASLWIQSGLLDYQTKENINTGDRMMTTESQTQYKLRTLS